VKVLPARLSENPEFRQRFEREAKTISQLSREGRELVYMEPPNRLMSVEVAAGDTFRPGIPRLLFEARFRQRAGRSYDFSPDGERIIANVVLGEESREQPITLVVNWMAGLPAK
jgi:hypothetical protein